MWVLTQNLVSFKKINLLKLFERLKTNIILNKKAVCIAQPVISKGLSDSSPSDKSPSKLRRHEIVATRVEIQISYFDTTNSTR